MAAALSVFCESVYAKSSVFAEDVVLSPVLYFETRDSVERLKIYLLQSSRARWVIDTREHLFNETSYFIAKILYLLQRDQRLVSIWLNASREQPSTMWQTMTKLWSLILKLWKTPKQKLH